MGKTKYLILLWDYYNIVNCRLVHILWYGVWWEKLRNRFDCYLINYDIRYTVVLILIFSMHKKLVLTFFNSNFTMDKNFQYVINDKYCENLEFKSRKEIWTYTVVETVKSHTRRNILDHLYSYCNLFPPHSLYFGFYIIFCHIKVLFVSIYIYF